MKIFTFYRITLAYEASCIPFNCDLVWSICPVPHECIPSGLVSATDGSVCIEIDSRFQVGRSYYLTLSTKDGKAVAKTGVFSVGSREINIYSDLKECYNPKEM